MTVAADRDEGLKPDGKRKSRRGELAAREFASALERKPERAWLWYLAARAARALLQDERARFFLDKALALKPGLEPARQERNALRQAPAPWFSTLLGWLGRRDV